MLYKEHPPPTCVMCLWLNLAPSSRAVSSVMSTELYRWDHSQTTDVNMKAKISLQYPIFAVFNSFFRYIL